MGFYSNQDGNKTGYRSKGRASSVSRFVATVVLSAVIGSGTTLAVASAVLHGNMTTGLAASSQTPSVSTTSSTVPTSVSVNGQTNISQIAKDVEPSVVAVVNYQNAANPYSGQSSLQEYGVGTGVYFYKDSNYAYMVTNNHVVQGAAKVEAVLQSGKHVKASVVGTDPFTDLAVIKVPVSNLNGVTPATFANSSNLQAGEPAIAIGTPMGLDFAESVTSGIVSAPSRVMPVENPDSSQVLDYQSVIQTDAAINPGNSGGPLLNAQGQVIGINSSKIVETDVQGMGFAIPSNEVVNIANQLLKTGHAVHPALGIGVVAVSDVPQGYLPNVPVSYGVLVEQVTSSEAKAAGLQQNDVIVAIDGHTVQNDADLRTYVFAKKPGDTVKLTIYRGSKRMTLNLKLSTMQSPNTTAQGQSSGGSNQNPYGQGSGGYGPGGSSQGGFGGYGQGQGGYGSYGSGGSSQGGFGSYGSSGQGGY